MFMPRSLECHELSGLDEGEDADEREFEKGPPCLHLAAAIVASASYSCCSETDLIPGAPKWGKMWNPW